MSILSYTFFQNALLGSLLASILCGLIGTYIVARRLVFISGGITHASFGGIGIGVYLGFSPILSAAVFSVLSACGIQWFSHRRDMREDSAIAIFWTLGMSIGIICSFLAPGFTPELSSYLFGNILTVTPSDLYLLGTLALIAIVAFTCFLRPLVSMAFDAEFARSQRLPVIKVEYLMMAFIALTIVACLRMVGIVLVISLLTIPQVTANIFTHSFKRMALLSIVTGYSGCLGGLYLSYHYNIPSGASIIFVSILIYLVCKGISWSIIRWRRQ
ncbi:MAG: metal ABC transporter permease [Paraprevotella clara]|nr:metal ABC transporter permease [Paraprevotella clara]